LGDSNTPTPGTGGVASEYGLVPAAQGPFNVGGTLAPSAKWAAVAAELRQASQTVPQYNTSPTLAVHYLSDATLGTVSSSDPSAVSVQWTMPASGTYSGTIFTKKAGGAPAGTPSDGTAYAVGSLVGTDAVVIHDNTTTGPVTVTDENGADSIVLPGTSYTYKGYARDDINISGSATTAPYYASGTTGSATTAAGGGSSKNWSYKTGAATLAPPSLNPNTGVIAGSNDNKVHSMSASTGVRNYQPAGSTGITGGAIQSRPAVIPQAVTTLTSCSCDVVYVGANDGKVYAFNAATGTNLWTSALLTDTGGFIQGGPAVQLKAYSYGSYTRSTDLVVVGTRNLSGTTGNKIYGLDGNTGAAVWTFAPGNLDIINSTPWIDYNTNAAWVTSNAGSLGGQPSIWKLDTATSNAAGSLLASITLSTTNKHIDTSPTLNEGAAAATFLYAVTKGNDLVAVDINPSSNAAYTTNVSGAASGGAGFPIPIVDGTTAGSDDLYFTLSGGSGGVYKRTFDRSTHAFGSGWDRTLAGASTPIFTPGASLAIYVGASDGKIYSLNPADGNNVGTPRIANASATTGDPSFDVVANKIYIGATDGRIYSFDKF
jgi:outer membrane protein assembly factor BamB